ncbi:unnamed protein product [Prorocentrum cordatum]|uniref:Uncharacterized protein n=1 Tax=Prorocentrum cordatum TaxID=2364126 RepID=A0ABN9TPV6_9DINO|nr:unnamed protein product [Polarella glacialis]
MAGAQPEALAGGEGAGAAAGAARELAEDRKAAGNGHFAAGDLEGALRCYGQAQAAAAAAGGERALVASLACNEALCLLRLGRPAEAEERASAALAADPASGKAAYRRALARLELGDARGALGDLQKAAPPEHGGEAEAGGGAEAAGRRARRPAGGRRGRGRGPRRGRRGRRRGPLSRGNWT